MAPVIRGGRGRLSNDLLGGSSLIETGVCIVLSHLSKENNFPA